MNRYLRILLCIMLVLALSSTVALAADPDSISVLDKSNNDLYKGSLQKGISEGEGQPYLFNNDFTVSFDNADAGEQYVLLMVKANVSEEGVLQSYSISGENILYIDQKTSGADGKITFEVLPSAMASSVFLLGGSFDQAGSDSPVILGTIFLSGVDVSGTVSYMGTSIPSVSLKPAEGSALQGTVDGNAYLVSGVPDGAYTLEVQKIGHLLHRVSVTVAGEDVVIPLITLAGGDTNADLYINASDLSNVLQQFGSSGVSSNGCDINEDTYINAGDLSTVLENFGKSTY